MGVHIYRVCTITLGDVPYLLSVVSQCVYDLNVTCKIQLFANELQANSDKRIVLPKIAYFPSLFTLFHPKENWHV